MITVPYVAAAAREDKSAATTTTLLQVYNTRRVNAHCTAGYVCASAAKRRRGIIMIIVFGRVLRRPDFIATVI